MEYFRFCQDFKIEGFAHVSKMATSELNERENLFWEANIQTYVSYCVTSASILENSLIIFFFLQTISPVCRFVGKFLLSRRKKTDSWKRKENLFVKNRRKMHWKLKLFLLELKRHFCFLIFSSKQINKQTIFI